jgi:hypothetical protein
MALGETLAALTDEALPPGRAANRAERGDLVAARRQDVPFARKLAAGGGLLNREPFAALVAGNAAACALRALRSLRLRALVALQRAERDVTDAIGGRRAGGGDQDEACQGGCRVPCAGSSEDCEPR